MVDEKYFPRYDVHEFGQLLTKTMAKALEMMKQFGIKHATYWDLPSTLRAAHGYLMRIDIPLDEFLPVVSKFRAQIPPLCHPWDTLAINVEPDSNVRDFNLTLGIDNKIQLAAETDFENLLTNQALLDALSSDNLLKLVNTLEAWISDHTRYIEEEYKDEPEEIAWQMTEPTFVQKKQQCHRLHKEYIKKL